MGGCTVAEDGTTTNCKVADLIAVNRTVISFDLIAEPELDPTHPYKEP